MPCLRDVVMPDHEGCDHITKAVVSTSPTGGHRQLISFSPAHLAAVAAIADFRLLAPPAHGYCTRRYSRPPPTWLKSLQSKGLSAIPTPLGVPAGVHVLAGPSVWSQKLRSAVRASGPPPSATRQARMSQWKHARTQALQGPL